MEQIITVVSVLKDQLGSATASLDKRVARDKGLGVEGLTYRVAGIREETCKVVGWSGASFLFGRHLIPPAPIPLSTPCRS